MTAAPITLSRLRLEVSAHLLVAAPLVVASALVLAGVMELPAWYAAAALGAFCVVAGLAWMGLPGHLNHGGWGTANRITLLRGGLIALVGGALPLAPGMAAEQAWMLAVIALVALALDGVDGWIARRQGMCSPYGARFDMELDALLILLLSLLLYLWGEAGVWVLGLGLMRHLFILAGMVCPVLAGPLPFSQRRRAICVVQVAVLAAGASPWMEPPLTGVAAGAALALLLFSFTTDTVWLIRHGGRANGTEHG